MNSPSEPIATSLDLPLVPDDAEVNDPGVTTDRTIYRPNPPPSGKSKNINRQPAGVRTISLGEPVGHALGRKSIDMAPQPMSTAEQNPADAGKAVLVLQQRAVTSRGVAARVAPGATEAGDRRSPR
jgi:hypothetical protein